jgi:ferredoxin
MKHLRIDGDICTGQGRCYTIAPALLAYDDDGFVTPRDADIEVSEAHETAAAEATGSCPEGAITFF